MIRKKIIFILTLTIIFSSLVVHAENLDTRKENIDDIDLATEEVKESPKGEVIHEREEIEEVKNPIYMKIQENSTLIFSLSVGVITTIVVLFIAYLIESNKRKQFKYLGDVQGKANRFKRKLKRNLKSKRQFIINEKERNLIIISGILVVTVSKNVQSVPKNLSVGLIIGLAVVMFFQNVKERNTHKKKVEEIAIAFEAIELYMKAGYSMYQAIRASRLLVDEIRPAIDTCLTYWSAGPKEALSRLQKELDVPEAETLILLLINLESSGSKEMEAAIGGEVFSIESIERMKANAKIANKPLTLMLYRMIPLASVLGIVVGSLLYRTFTVLESTGLGIF